MKRYLWFLPLLLLLAPATGCTTTGHGLFWMSGPWTDQADVMKQFDKLQIGSLQEEVKDQFGEPSEIKYATGANGEPLKDSKEAWLLYKYDYPSNPLLLTIKVDRFGIVTEKHADNPETVADTTERRKTAEEQASYPGAPQRQFQELIKKHTKEGGYQ